MSLLSVSYLKIPKISDHKLPNRWPSYLIMPPEFNWKEVKELLEKSNNEKSTIWGKINVVKVVSRIDSKETTTEKFRIVIHQDCGIGRCFKLGTAKDFMYPTDKHILSSIYTNQMSYQEVTRFKSWVECDDKEIRLVVFPTIKERQAKYKYWLNALKDEQKALKKVAMKTVWKFSTEKLGIEYSK